MKKGIPFHNPITLLYKKASTVFIINVVGTGINYISHVLLGRWIGVSGYGSYAYALSWVYSLVVLCGLGFTVSVLRYVPEYRAKKDSARLRGFIRASFPLVLISSIVLASIMTAIIALGAFPNVNNVTLLIGIWILPFISQFYLAIETIRAWRYVGTAYLPHMILQPVLHLLIVSAIYLYKGKLESEQAILSFLVSTMVFMICHYFVLRNITKEEASGAKSIYEVVKWLKVSLPMMMMIGFHAVIGRMDVLLIGMLIGAKDAGVYNAASKTAFLVSFILLAVNSIAAPMISEYHNRKDQRELQKIVGYSTKLSFYPSIAFGLFLFGFSETVLSLFGADFEGGAWPLRLLVLGYIANTSVGPAKYLVNLTGIQNKSVGVYGFCVVVNIFLNLMLIPKYGTIGAAIATVSSMVLSNVSLSVLAKKHLGINTFVINFK
jgi:O-antigen/teichoic acid export membrane protein